MCVYIYVYQSGALPFYGCMNNNVWFTNGLPIFTLKKLITTNFAFANQNILITILTKASAPLLMKPPGVARVDLRLQ